MGIRSEKSTVRSGHQRRQKSSPVGGRKGFTGVCSPTTGGDSCHYSFSSRTLGGEGGSSRSPAVRVPPALGYAAEQFPPRWAEEGAAGLFGAPPPKHRAVGGGDRQVASRPLGAGSAVFGGGVHFALFLFYPKWPGVQGAGRAELEVVHPTRAKRRPPLAERGRWAALGELKFKCDPRRGRGRGQEPELRRRGRGRRRRKRAPLKGQRAPRGGAQLPARPRGCVASAALREEMPPNLASPKVRGL